MLKLVILPVLIVAAAIGMGFRGAELMVLALMFSSPTAAAAFVMAVSMKADGQLTANVIALSTLGAAFSVSAMIYVLTLAGLV
jgi:predicted permease